jgi:hypothetical protein
MLSANCTLPFNMVELPVHPIYVLHVARTFKIIPTLPDKAPDMNNVEEAVKWYNKVLGVTLGRESTRDFITRELSILELSVFELAKLIHVNVLAFYKTVLDTAIKDKALASKGTDSVEEAIKTFRKSALAFETELCNKYEDTTYTPKKQKIAMQMSFGSPTKPQYTNPILGSSGKTEQTVEANTSTVNGIIDDDNFGNALTQDERRELNLVQSSFANRSDMFLNENTKDVKAWADRVINEFNFQGVSRNVRYILINYLVQHNYYKDVVQTSLQNKSNLTPSKILERIVLACPAKNEIEFERSWSSLKQDKDETSQKWSERLISLGNQAPVGYNMTEKMMFLKFISGLRNEIFDVCSFGPCNNIREALQEATAGEEKLRRRAASSTPSNNPAVHAINNSGQQQFPQFQQQSFYKPFGTNHQQQYSGQSNNRGRGQLQGYQRRGQMYRGRGFGRGIQPRQNNNFALPSQWSQHSRFGNPIGITVREEPFNPRACYRCNSIDHNINNCFERTWCPIHRTRTHDILDCDRWNQGDVRGHGLFPTPNTSINNIGSSEESASDQQHL